MSLECTFLGWNRPSLAAAADYLLERFGAAGTLDLEDVIVVVPGGRAGRRLLEILVERADELSRALSPPRIVTIGRLPERLYTAARPFADELTQQLAWIEAIEQTDPERLARLIPALPAKDDLPVWLALGEMLGRLHRELAAEAMDFPVVAACGSGIEDFHEEERWEALAEVQRRYLATLDDLELWDLQTARLFAIRQGECRSDATIVLVGTVDMNRAMRQMLDQVAERVTALVFAPQELASRFDALGCLLPEAWQDVEIAVPTDRIEVVDDPADQAAAVVRAVASLDGQYRAEQITIGVPDVRIVPHVEQHLAQCDIPARYGVGRPVQQSAPYRLLAMVADYLENDRFRAFAALVRHPAVEQWLLARDIRGDWLGEMDDYHAEHLPYRLGEPWMGKTGDCRNKTLRQVHEAIGRLLEGLGGRPQPLPNWGEPLVALLIDVFGREPLDPANRTDRPILAACEAVHGVLAGYRAVPERLCPSVTGADAVRLILRQIAIVPASLGADLFLPNQLRRALGIEDNDRRWARDAYALTMLAASRRELRLVAGRRTTEGDPLVPSRLLFATDRETAARRALRFFHDEQTPIQPVTMPGTLQPGREQSKLDVPRPQPLAEPVTSMRVTEFRDYLACPYRYYLRHRLGLSSPDDAAEELEPGAFGSLAHAVLAEFGVSPLAGSTDAKEIRDCLDGLLDRCVAGQYGESPLSAVRVQVEQLRRRLGRFAQWQADWAAEGWRIEYVETGPEPGKAAMTVDGRPMFLRGRIDRIDVNEATGKRFLFDYKTSDKAKTPERAHRTGGEWTDLQLPLYRRLAAAVGITGPITPAYIVLPKDTDQVACLAAEWTDADLQDADRVAEEVIRAVWAEEFWPPTDPPPPFSEDFAAICQDGQFATISAVDENGGDER
jgi:hypothetical protein